MKSPKVILFFIFLLALTLRFLYFPQNTYFGFDQARDAYASLEITKGDLKIVGPPTANQVIHHGVLYYYIFAPFYYFGGGDPNLVSSFLRILNASGIFLVFLISLILFGRVAAIFASFLFAISFEQTQFSLFLNHPSLAVISVLIFYLGLSKWIFRNKSWGFFLGLFGLGLSIQFEFVEIQLIPIFILFLLIFKRSSKINLKTILIGVLVFMIPVSSYIFSEIKNDFIITKQIPNLFFNNSGLNSPSSFSQFLFFINRHFHDNLIAQSNLVIFVELLFLIILINLILKKIYVKQLIFLMLWFFGGLLVYFFTNNDGYFYNTGTSIAILIFASFLLSKLFSRNKLLAFSILILIFLSNMYLITKNNPLGPNPKINPQIGLLLEDEKRVLDFIYKNANEDNFAVNALTNPLYVNTTWSYLFEWYGVNTYGYTPIWGGDAADGFPGNLKIERARSKLLDRSFLIIEPQEGIPVYLKESFIENEENYASVVEKKKIGAFEVWVQRAK